MAIRRRVGDRSPDFAGHHMANHIVATSVGAAILRLPRTDVDSGFDPRMVPEATALGYAHDHGVRVPRVLYAENDVFLIEELVTGEEPSVDDWATWLPNLLSEVTALQSGPPQTRGSVRSVYDWQLWMTSILDQTYASVRPQHRKRISELRIPRLHDFWQASESHHHRNLTLVHSDLHPKNLLTDQRGLWILDWELTLIADPIWEAAVSLHRTPWPTRTARERATELWLMMLASLGHDAETLHTVLAEYSTVEVWRSLINDSWRYPQMISVDPGRSTTLAASFHHKLAVGASAFGCIDLCVEEICDLLQRWAKECEYGGSG